MSKRPRYHHGDLRRALLEASVELLEEGGLAGLSLREVARRAGVTHSAPYHYFEDRSALLSAVAEEGFATLTRALEEATRSASDPMARYAALGCAYVSFAVTNPGYFRIMFRPELAELKDCENPDHVAHRAFGILVEAVQECQAAGVSPPGDPTHLVLVSWSLVHGLASLWLDGPLSRSRVGEGVHAQQLAQVVTRTLAELMRRSASEALPFEFLLPVTLVPVSGTPGQFADGAPPRGHADTESPDRLSCPPKGRPAPPGKVPQSRRSMLRS